MTTNAGDVVERLAAAGVRFVLLAPSAEPESASARAFRLSASTALNQRDGLDSVGETARGDLWRVTQHRAAAGRGRGMPFMRSPRWIAIVQLAVVAAALLLALPTRTSRREARRASRIVGPLLAGGAMSDRRVFRWATTSARMLAGTLVAVAFVVAVVTAAAVPWPTLTHEPLRVEATPAPSDSVVACTGGLLAARSRDRRAPPR